jgi:putative ABC transport system permease protein
VNIAVLATRNGRRHATRLALSVLGMGLALCGFIVLRVAVAAFHASIGAAPADRLVVFHQTGQAQLPRRTFDAVAATPGVSAAHLTAQTRGWLPGDRTHPFYVRAVNAETFLAVFDEVELSEAAWQRWQHDRSGVVINRSLAKRLGVEVGAPLGIETPRGSFRLTVDGIFESEPGPMDLAVVVMHYDLMNQALPAGKRDLIDLVLAKVDSGDRIPEIANSIRTALRRESAPTMVTSEAVMASAALRQFAPVILAIDVASLVSILVVFVIMANMMAMGIRERTPEYAVLRALGFARGYIAAAVVLEAASIGLAASLVAVAIGHPLINVWMHAFINREVGILVAAWNAGPERFALMAALAMLASVGAALAPAWRAATTPVIAALRHVG